MDSELSSPGPRTFQGNMRTPCDRNLIQTVKFEVFILKLKITNEQDGFFY